MLHEADQRIKGQMTINGPNVHLTPDLSIVVQPGKDARLQCYLNLPGESGEGNAFSRDVSNIGRRATGSLDVNVPN